MIDNWPEVFIWPPSDQTIEGLADRNGLGHKKEYLPKEPEKIHLLPFLRGRLRTKRLRKKFLKDPHYYKLLVICEVWDEWEIKRWWKVGKISADYILDTLARTGFARRLFTVEVPDET